MNATMNAEPEFPAMNTELCRYCHVELAPIDSGGDECSDCWEIKRRVASATKFKLDALFLILRDCGIHNSEVES